MPDDKMPLKMQITKEADRDVSKIYPLFYFVAVVFILLPLLATSFTGQLLERTMYWAQVRIEGGLLYVKEPYNRLLSEALISRNKVTVQDFTAFEGVTVLFQGIGNNVVVEFKDGDYLRQLRIPNDSIIVERKRVLSNREKNSQ